MNFKKNYKKIIIVCLIMLILSYKISENFTTAQALDAVKSTEKKVNDMFHSVDGKYLKTNKEIKTEKVTLTKDKIWTPNMQVDNIKVKNTLNMDGGKKICIGGTCLDENILKRLNKIEKPPTRQGCYLYTESPCKQQVHTAPPPHAWFRDNHNHASYSDAHCKKRVADFNGWCGSTDFKYHFQK